MINESDMQTIEHRLGALFAAHAGLRRFVLEWHCQSTGAPMNQAEQKMRGYIEAEYAQMIQDAARDISPEWAALMDCRRPPQAPPPTA